MKKTFLAAVFVLTVLFSATVMVQCARFVSAQTGFITITADGNVEPSTAHIQRIGDTYTFTDDIEVVGGGYVPAGIQVLKDNIVIDGAHFSIYASDSAWNGIDLSGRRNVEVKNLEIRGFGHGIFLDDASGNTVCGNEIIGFNGSGPMAVPTGIWLSGSSNNTITSNKITSNIDYGILIQAASTDNTLVGNIITDNGVGIALDYCPDNILRNNQMNGNYQNFKLGYNSFSQFIQDIDTSNTIDGKPVYYWLNEHDKTVPSDAGFVALGNCTNITVKDLQISHSYDSITLIGTNDSVIMNNYVDNCGNGIFLKYCQNINVTKNAVTGNLEAGIGTTGCNNSIIAKNDITNCKYGLITDRRCVNIMICENNISKNDRGVELVSSKESFISGNYFEKNRYGANVVSSSQNNFIENIFVENSEGAVRISGAPNNTFCHNNFVNNSLLGSCQIFNPWLVVGNPEDNIWDNGFAGNYWNDFKQRYPNASEILGKGVWDTPYVINEKNIDHYPLVAPYGNSNAALPSPEPTATPSPSPSQEPTPTQTPTSQAEPEPLPMAVVAAASAASIAVVGAGLLLYFKKRNH